jgi:hypothetical protein
MSKVLSILEKGILLMQIAALSLMQGYVLKPFSGLQISNRVEEGTRVLQHQCGCRPEKVASHACCCYTGNCRTSPGSKATAINHPNARKPSANYTSPPSCGCTEDSYGMTLGKFEFIRTSFRLFRGDHVVLFSPSKQVDCETLAVPPPVPPPETLLLVPIA